jgi:hypothetical protein
VVAAIGCPPGRVACSAVVTKDSLGGWCRTKLLCCAGLQLAASCGAVCIARGCFVVQHSLREALQVCCAYADAAVFVAAGAAGCCGRSGADNPRGARCGEWRHDLDACALLCQLPC